MLKNKIDLLRGNFRREAKKPQISAADTLYIPKLWDYQLLLFLSDQEEVRVSTSTLHSPSMEETESECVEEQTPFEVR